MQVCMSLLLGRDDSSHVKAGLSVEDGRRNVDTECSSFHQRREPAATKFLQSLLRECDHSNGGGKSSLRKLAINVWRVVSRPRSTIQRLYNRASRQHSGQ